MWRSGGVVLLALAVGCGRSVRHVDGSGDAGVGPSADDPQGFSEPPADVCICAGDELSACCETHAFGFGACECGDDDLGGQSCESFGYVSGALGCASSCFLDFSRCEDCAAGGPVTACAHPFERNDDARLIALASNGDELGVALVTGTSTELGYDGNTSVRLALLDADLHIESSIAVPLQHASKLSLSATPDGWLLLVETLNYEGFDAPPNGVVQTLLSFDGAGQLRGTAAFQRRRDGFLVPREGAEPLYVFATDRAAPTTWGQVLSYAGDADVAPFVAHAWLGSASTVPACATTDDSGVWIYGSYASHGEVGYVGTLVLSQPGMSGRQAFEVSAPGPCALDPSLGLMYQAESPDDGELATLLRYPATAASAFQARDSQPIAAYRVAGFPSDSRALVLRAPSSDTGPTELQIWDTRLVASYVATTVARGPHVPSYDVVRFGDDAIAGWIAQPPGNTGFGRVTLARLRPALP